MEPFLVFYQDKNEELISIYIYIYIQRVILSFGVHFNNFNATARSAISIYIFLVCFWYARITSNVYIYFETLLGDINITTNTMFTINNKLLSLLRENSVF